MAMSSNNNYTSGTMYKPSQLEEPIKSFSLHQITEIICDATFEPVLICSMTTIHNCNLSFLSTFGYESIDGLRELSVTQIICKHFYPALIQPKDDNTTPPHISDITRAKAYPGLPEEKVCPVRVKRWEFLEEEIYTISIKVDSILSRLSVSNITNRSNLSNDITSPLLFSNIKSPTSSFNNFDNLSISQNGNKNIPDPAVALFNEFSMFFDFLPCMVWYSDQNGALEFMNRKYKETLGIEDVKEDFAISIHPDDYKIFVAKWRSHFKSSKGLQIELRLRYNPNKPLPPGRTREYRWHLVRSVPIPHPKNPKLSRWAHSGQDIHDLKTAEDEKIKLIASEKAAIDASKSKSDFLATMSHEIRTPLFGVVGSACLLKDTNLNSEQRELVDSIEFSGRLLMTVIQDVLDFSRIESGKLSIQNSDFKIEKLLKHLGQMLKLEACKKSLTFKITIPKYEGSIFGDSGRLLQVLTNLTSNAIKFTSKGSVCLNVSLLPTEDKYSGILKVKVTDTGIGISQESIPKLFTPWTQADVSKRRYYGGSGLGLSICKSLIGLMDGDIGLESRLGEGTTVSFHIPVKVDIPFNELEQTTLSFAPSPALSRSPATTSEEFPGFVPPQISIPSLPKLSQFEDPSFLLDGPKLKRKATDENNVISNQNQTENGNRLYRLLLVEDNPINQAILCKFLDKMGGIDYKVIGDGQEALNLYHQKGEGYYDAILLDQTLPGLTGDQVCKQIREVDINQILISISANALLTDHVRFIDIGMNDHISKPVTFGKFQQVLNHWLLRSKNKNKNKNNGNNGNNG